ncbi:MAG: ABC transporter substrate-binding protein [Oscillospiraceae bacterium]|nr:ABC transporter substrate-binding protein [Oscillospiraceae bacterium]
MKNVKFVKKALAMVLAAAMSLSLAACGSGAASSASAASAAASAADSAPAAAVPATEETQASTAGETTANEGTVYKVGIVKYVDDASLDQIESAIQAELDAKGQELGVTFDYADYTKNGQADSTTLNQIASDLVADNVDVIIPIATPAALIMQTATEENQIPVVFSAVSDPVSAGLVESLDAPGSNVTGTSDALNVEAVIDLMLAANPDMKKLGLLYDQGQDASKSAIASAEAYCQEKGIEVVEKTGTTNDEIALAADALIAAGVDAVFTPTDNTVMTAELAIYEKFVDAKIPHYAGADSFALNGAFCGYGVNYVTLGTATADIVVDILVNGADPAATPVQIMSSGIAMVNTETAEAIGLDYSAFNDLCEEVKETVTQESFD